jgi:hypothetical protein
MTASATAPAQQAARDVPAACEDDAAGNAASSAAAPGRSLYGDGAQPAPDDASDPAAHGDARECELVQVFRAHGAAAACDHSPARVAPNTEDLRQFYFDTPWNGEMQLLRSRVVGINTSIVHHWALYVVHSASVHDGEILSGHNLVDVLKIRDAQFLVGGGAQSNIELPEGVGLDLPHDSGTGYLLEVHYFNASADQTVEDATGVELCVTSVPQPNRAAAHLLGRHAFSVPAHSKADVVSTCRPSAPAEPVHILAIMPHMHETGVHAKVVLNRSTGQQQTLHDAAFVAKEQRTFRVPDKPTPATPDVVVEPGDTLTTTCTFDNPRDESIEAGPFAENEMCIMLAWAWPAGVLKNEYMFGGDFGVSEDEDCMEP